MVNYYELIAAFAVAFFLALALTPAAIWLAPKVGAMDIPKDDRRMHTKAIPRFGGLAIFAGFMASFLLFVVPERHSAGVAVGAVIIYIMGVLDDIKTFSPKIKLAGQILAACIVYASGVRVTFISDFFGLAQLIVIDVVCFIVTILWIVGITNAVNLVDGLDGLAAGISAIAALCIAYAAYVHGQYIVTAGMLSIAGAALGFLPYNFHPAKVFMGDGGSQLLGFALATVSLVQPAKAATVVALVIPALVLGLPIFDTLFAILRRLIRGQSVVTADKEHLHHRIMRAGFGQTRSVLIMYGISGIMGIVAVLYSREFFVETLGLLAVAVMLLYVLMSDTSTKRIRIHAVNIKRQEHKELREKRRRNEAKQRERQSDKE